MPTDASSPEEAFEAPSEQAEAAPSPGSERPTAVLVLGAVAVALGLVGLLGVLMGCFGTVSTLAGFGTASPAGLPPEAAEAQQQLLSTNRRLLPLSSGLLAATAPLAGLLLTGGVAVLADHRSGARLLRWAFVYGLVLEPIRLLVGLGMQWVNLDALQGMFGATLQPPAGAGLSPEVEAMLRGLVIVAVVGGVAFGVVWFALKMALYGVGLRVLGSERARAWAGDVSG